VCYVTMNSLHSHRLRRHYRYTEPHIRHEYTHNHGTDTFADHPSSESPRTAGHGSTQTQLVGCGEVCGGGMRGW
jgi:hypothetical protein